ncbi:hypothetical protein QQS21_010666 [Conoideocrella luteorostrata]|uniref:Ubiquitin-conjugating enzyme n=1 Tax=Conoideocrella luteorostrata TaxID=1105319 RepID=A0AAJ0CHA3_9HYPO|nr:hypothetical protein QQS21_010666 [Conoideocrella luteorostrata]
MYTTDIQDNGTVSATDHERLPPGGFSLRHGFPEWFRRGKHAGSDRTNAPPIGSSATSPESPNANTPSYLQAGKPNVSIYSILKYVRSTFDSAEMLDSVPFAAAGNPGAWHAWRTHRLKQGKLSNQQPGTVHSTQPNEPSVAPAEKEKETLPSPNSAIRQPGEWNWDGVWEDRVKKGVAACLTEPVLYGGSGVPDEMIRFLPMEETDIESVKENIRRTLDSAA